MLPKSSCWDLNPECSNVANIIMSRLCKKAKDLLKNVSTCLHTHTHTALQLTTCKDDRHHHIYTPIALQFHTEVLSTHVKHQMIGFIQGIMAGCSAWHA